MLKELSNPDKSTETVLEQFMQKLSTAEKPSSAIRGLLRRISEEIAGDTDDCSRDRLSLANETQGLHERRNSSISGHSSMPTTPNTINYDSGFSEQLKIITNGTKATPVSLLPRETIDVNKEFLESAEGNIENGLDSETSTDCSPYSTLSMNGNPFRMSRTAIKSASARRASNRRRSTGGVGGSRPSSKVMAMNGTGSCPNVDGNRASPLPGSAIKYSRSEVDAIRKFLSLTSVYFGSRAPANDIGNANYDEVRFGILAYFHTEIRKQSSSIC